MTADRWYYIDDLNQPHGPYLLEEIRGLVQREPCLMVAPEGSTDWLWSTNYPELTKGRPTTTRIVLRPTGVTIEEGPAPRKRIRRNADGQPINRALNRRNNLRKCVDELMGICKGILVDGDVTSAEAEFLHRWCAERRAELGEWPLRDIVHRLDGIFEDGVVSTEESDELRELLTSIIGRAPAPDQAGNFATRLPLDDPPPTIEFPGRAFCVTGKFVYGSRSRVEETIARLGGVAHPRITRSLHYVVIGTIASRDWIQSSHGRKIEAAVELRDEGVPIAIISEEHWCRAVSR